MGRWFPVTAIVVLLACGPALAQSARPAPLPPPLDQRLPPSQSAPRPDVFQATPETYAPHYDHPVPAPPPAAGVIYGPWGPYPQWAQPIIVSPTVVVSPPAAEPRPATPPPAPAPPVPHAQPRTFYVIPGCYAGDRRPEPGSLPRGCSVSKLRAIPPVVNRHS